MIMAIDPGDTDASIPSGMDGNLLHLLEGMF